MSGNKLCGFLLYKTPQHTQELGKYLSTAQIGEGKVVKSTFPGVT